MRAPTGAFVYVVDDDAEVRESLSSLLRSHGLRVAAFASPGDFLRHPRADAPACLVLDMVLPGTSGLDLLQELSSSEASLPIICISGYGTVPMSVRAMKEGAVEFLTKPFPEEELIAAVGQAIERDRAERHARAELATLRLRFERLTPREREVLALVVEGRLNKQIAGELGAAEQTIKVHRGRVMRKLEARSVPDLVRFMERIAGQPWAPPADTPGGAPPPAGGAPEEPVIRK